MDNLIKPIGSLGRLEDIAIQLARITGRVKNKMERNVLLSCLRITGSWMRGKCSSPDSNSDSNRKYV